MRKMINPKAPMMAAPKLVTLMMLLYSSLLGFLVMRNTLTVSFINLFSLPGGASSISGGAAGWGCSSI